MEKLLRAIKKMLPESVLHTLQPIYHFKMALFAALLYRFPSRSIKVVGVTGTKGKTTVTEMVAAILSEAGYRVALSNTYRFKIADKEERNMHKMTMPGRFFVQHFLRRAVDAKCDFVVLEMTSEGVRQFRHKFISLDALIFTNLSPEHIESHGSFENYRDAKRELGISLVKSRKKEKVVVANAEDPEGAWYLGLPVEKSVVVSLEQATPYEKTESGYTFTFGGEEIKLLLPGEFNLMNTLLSISLTKHLGISINTIKTALARFTGVRGRVEFVQREPFSVVVDYAHTVDSLKQFYKIFERTRNICVLGNTGGGRDSWKRAQMAHVAEENCEYVILTNEDPYDENPEEIIKQMTHGVEDKKKLEIIIDRRQAIIHALELAGPSDSVLITGKGTDPYIMLADGEKMPWDDVAVVREELERLSRLK